MLTTPYVMFEIKKKTQILIEFLDCTKKVKLAGKKSFLVTKNFPRVQRISYIIFAVDHPLCDVWNQKKTQNLIEFLDGRKKVLLAGKKNFLVAKKSFLGFRGFVHNFCCWLPPMWCLKSKKNSNSYWILWWHEKSTASRQKKFG